jgi:Skp family chaperone for outer membrane proteins
MLRILTLLLAGVSVMSAQVATINLQKAIANSEEGRRESARMRSEFQPKLAALEKREAEWKADREKLDRESKQVHGWWLWRHTMKPKEKARRQGELDVRNRALMRERDDDRAAFEQERQRVVATMGKRITALLETYAKEHGYSVIIDSGNENGGLIVTLNDVTDQIVTLYDRNYHQEQ